MERLPDPEPKVSRRQATRMLFGTVAALTFGRQALSILEGCAHAADAGKLDLETFHPADGVVLESRFDPKHTKTVIYLADVHPEVGDIEALSAQKGLWSVLQELVSKCDKLPVVVEAWSKGATGDEYFKEQERFIATPRGASFPGWSDLIAIFREPDLTKRIAMANQLAGKHPILASLLAIAVFKDEVTPIGVAPRRENGAKELMAVNRLTGMLRNMDGTLCLSGSDVLTLEQAMLHFKRHEGAAPGAVPCYCGFREELNTAIKTLNAQRMATARLEAETALAIQSPVVVIYSGAGHAAEVQKVLKSNPINYALIAPKELEEITRKILRDGGLSYEKGLKDDERGRCERFSEELRIGQKQPPRFINAGL